MAAVMRDKPSDSRARDSALSVVVGLGKTGLSCARWLAARGEQVAVTDSRDEPPGLAGLHAEWPQVAVHAGGFDPALLARAGRIVLSPGVPLAEPALAAAIADGVEVVGDIELFARVAKAPVVAITGSNAKSTVTTLVGEMARAAGLDARVGGNLGTPALDLLPSPGTAEPDLYVLELSSFQLETTATLDAAAAVVLNISPDHLDRYPDLAAYAAAKRRVFQGGGVMVVNADDPAVAAMAEPNRRVIRFGLGVPAADDYGLRRQDGADWLCRGREALLPVGEMRIRGYHNAANALAALALGEAAGLPRAAMLAALRDFTGLPHRCQWVAEVGGVHFYDDSKGTNVGATLAALQGLGADGRVVLIAGGLGKEQDFSPLRPGLAACGRAAVLIGRDAPRIEAALGGAVPVVRAAGMSEAVAAAAALAQPGDSVLLSPACASFDMFRDYVHRGEVFVAAVRELAP